LPKGHVRAVRLPDELGEKGDLRDYLNGRPATSDESAVEPFGTADDLKALIDSTPLREPDANISDFSDSSGHWERPVEFGAGMTGPEVPLEALPTDIGNYVKDVAEVHKVPADLVAGVALGVLAAAAAKRAVVSIGDTHEEPLNLFVMPIAAPGERKAQAIRSMIFPIEDVERRLVEISRDEIRQADQVRSFGLERIKVLQKQAANKEEPSVREALAREAAEIERDLPSVTAVPQLVLDDATTEYVAKALSEQSGRIAIVSEEAGSLIATMTGRYSKIGESDLDVYLKSYDGGQIRVGRMTRDGLTVQEPALTIVVTPQPAILDQVATHGELRGRGLIGRFCLIFPESQVGTRTYENRAVNQRVKDAYAKIIELMLRRELPEFEETPRLRIEGKALEVWAEYADAVEAAQAEGGRLAAIRDWASKHPGRVARIAGLFHLVRHSGQKDPASTPILEEDVASAWAVGEWLLDHALAVFARIGADAASMRAKEILRWIRQKEFDEFSLATLHNSHRVFDRAEEFLPALTVLESRGFIQKEPPPKEKRRGRPRSAIYRVNPLTHSKNSENPKNSNRPIHSSNRSDSSGEVEL
jgi:replicative DNA helicase